MEGTRISEAERGLYGSSYAEFNMLTRLHALLHYYLELRGAAGDPDAPSLHIHDVQEGLADLLQLRPEQRELLIGLGELVEPPLRVPEGGAVDA